MAANERELKLVISAAANQAKTALTQTEQSLKALSAQMTAQQASIERLNASYTKQNAALSVAQAALEAATAKGKENEAQLAARAAKVEQLAGSVKREQAALEGARAAEAQLKTAIQQTTAQQEAQERSANSLGGKLRQAFTGIGDYAKSQLAGIGQVAAGMLGGNLIMGAISQVRAGFASIANVFREGVTGGAEFERYETQLGVLLKSTDLAKERLQELAVFGQKTPFELPEIVRAEKVLTSFGLTGEDAMKKFGKSAAQIRTMIGDVASGTGQQFEAIAGYVGRFASGSTGEAIQRFQELGVVTRQELAKMGLEFSKAGQLMTPVEEATTVLLQVMSDKFGGMMDKQSATFEGMQSNLADWMGQTKRIIAEPIFDALKDNLGELLNVLNSSAVQDGIKNVAAALADVAKRVSEVSLLLLKGDIEGALAKITNPETARGLMEIAKAFNAIHEGIANLKGDASMGEIFTNMGGAATAPQRMVEGIGGVSSGLENLKTIMASVDSGAVSMGQGMGAALAVMFGVGDASANAMQKITTATQSAQAATSAYSYTVSDSSIVARALANEAKYGADNVQVLAMNMTNARAAAESFNTGAAMVSANITAMAAASQQSGAIMASAFSSDAVQSAMAAFQSTVAEFQAQQLAQEEQSALASEQAAFARNAQLLMAEAQYQQQRAMQVAQGEAQIAALQAAGQAQKAAAKQADLDADLAQSDAKHQASIAQEEAQYQQQSQIQERALLVQRVQALQSYQAQLQDQQDAVLRALALAVQEATQKAGIEAESQKAVLDMIYGAGSAALQAEYGFAQDRLAIEQDLAEGRLTSAESQIKAILAVQEAEKGNAAAALQSAKAALAGFKIEAPKLPAIDTSSFKASIPAAASAGGAAGAAASKPMADKFTSALGSINSAIDSAQNALVKLLGFDLPAGWQAGLEKLKTFSRSLVAMMEETAKDITLKDAKTSEKIAKAMDRTMGAFAKFAQVTQIFAAQPVNEAMIDAWLQQYHLVVGKILDAVTELQNTFGGYEGIKNLYKTAKRFKTLLESVLIELSAVKVVELPDLNVWRQQIIAVVTTAVQTVAELEAQLGGATGLKKSVANIGQIKSLIDLANSELGGMKTSALPDLTSWKEQFIAVVRTAVQAVAEAETTIGVIPISRAAELAPKLKTLVDAVSGGFDALKPAEAEGFEARIDAYFSQAKLVFGKAVAWLYQIYTDANTMVTHASEIAGPVQAVFGILSVDLAKAVPQGEGFEVRVTEYLSQLRMVGGLIVKWLSEIKGAALTAVVQAAGVSEHVNKLFGLIGADLSKAVPQGAGFEERATTYLAQLRWLGGRIFMWLNEIVSAGFADAVKKAAEVGDYVSKLFGLIGPDLSKLVPQDAGFQARALAYVAQIKWTGGQIFAWLREIKGSLIDEVKQASEIADSVKKLFDLLGVDLTKIVPAGANFPAMITTFLSSLTLATTQIVPWLKTVRDTYTGEALEEATKTADAVKSVLELLGMSEMFTKIADLSKINVAVVVGRMATKLEEAVDKLVPALQSIQEKWGGALGAVKVTAENIKSVFAGIYDIAKAIDDAAQLGGIDVGTAQALINQFARLGMLTLPSMTAPPAGGAIASGGDVAQSPLDKAVADLAAVVESLSKEGIMLTIHGYGDDGSEGEYSDRVRRGQNVSIDMRSWSAAKSG